MIKDPGTKNCGCCGQRLFDVLPDIRIGFFSIEIKCWHCGRSMQNIL
ncbi:MAG: hypothetical protein PHZ09_08690 [Eubacteriales bacterium]|nr:hypothetical protein [Eubacteriales bacterium]